LWVPENPEEAPINSLLGASITYRIATGPREGQKLFTLQTLPAEPEGPRRDQRAIGWKAAGAVVNNRCIELQRYYKCLLPPKKDS
jgi:hypothetical protein